MNKKIQEILEQKVDLSAFDYETARYIENLRGMLEETQREKRIMLDNRLGLHFSPKSYEDRFDDWLEDAVVPVLDPELSRFDEDTGNLIIEGDNIDALRVLARTHKGKIDCIFIDPPYNTENTTFVYNDDYVASEDKYRYSMWLEGLKRRLRYVPDLLSERGVLLVAINDDNRSYVELLIKENIMPGCPFKSFVWRTSSGKNQAGETNISIDHEHVLIFSNNKGRFKGNEKSYESYRFDDQDGRGEYALGDLTCARTAKGSPKSYYHIQNPEDGLWYACNPDRVWFVATAERLNANQKIKTMTMEDMIEDKRVAFPKNDKSFFWESMEELLHAIDNGDVPKNGRGTPLIRRNLPDLDFFIGKRFGSGMPAFKRYKNNLQEDNKPISSWISSVKEDIIDGAFSVSSPTSSVSNSHLKAIFDEKVFDYSKPVELVQSLISQVVDKNSIVLDFFGGSGTTAEAVLRLNHEDDGDRKFIMVSNTERTADEPDKNICRDVLAARVGAVINGFTKGKNEIEGTGGGFAYLRMERHDDEAICGPLPYELSMDMAFTLCQISFGLPVQVIDTGDKGYAVREIEDEVIVFAPEWSKALTEGVKAEFDARPGKVHIVLSNRDETPTHHLREAGCVSAKCLDAIVFAGRLCGPAAFFQRGA